MKKLLLISLCGLFLLNGCASKDTDELAPYRHKTSAQLLHDGEKSLSESDFDQAIQNYEALDAIYPFGPDSRQGDVDSIYAYYAKGDTASAVAAADRYVQLYPQGNNVDYALYMKGVVLFADGVGWLQSSFGQDPALSDISSKKLAYSAFNELVKHFPHSQYAGDAKVRMLSVRNLIARKQLQTADFYLRRKAYVAAINRAAIVLQRYDGTPSVIPALVILVKSYRHLGLNMMANNTLAVMKASFPNAPQFKRFLR